MTVEIDKSRISSELGAARPLKLPATEYLQGGRTMYHITAPLAQIPQIVVKRPDPDRPIEGNRRVDPNRARKFGEYITKNEDWVSPAIIVRVPSGEIKFDSVHRFEDGSAWGELSIPLHVLSEVLLLDGQHRTLGVIEALDEANKNISKLRDAIENAKKNGNNDTVPEFEKRLDEYLKIRERFTNEHVSVDIAVVTTNRATQMFADINNNAKGVNPDYTTVLDQRQVVNRIAVDLIKTHPLLVGRVEMGQSGRMSKTNPNLLGAKTVSDIVRAVNLGVAGRVGARVEDELTSRQVEATENVKRFLDVLLAGSEELQAVVDGQIEPVELRDEESENRSMFGSATMLRVLAGTYHELTKPAENKDDPKPLTRAEIEVFFRELAPRMRDIPVAEDDKFWLPTKAFIPGTTAPQARQGTLTGLVRALTGWARNGLPEGA
jgi:hypothetical protein